MSLLDTSIAPGDPGHIDDHELVHDLLDEISDASFGVAGIKRGLLAARPAAADAVDMFYFATDVPALTYSDGSTWRQAVLNTTSNTWTGPQTFDDDGYFGSGHPWVDVRHPNYDGGAAGDGVADDTLSLQEAIDTGFALIFLGVGTFKVTSLAMDNSDQSLVGGGPGVTEITSTSDDVIVISAAGVTKRRGQLRDLTVHSRTGGGHCINALGGVSAWMFVNVYLDQDNAAQSLYHHDSPTDIYIGNRWEHCNFTHETTATAPGFSMVASSSVINANVWDQCVCTNSGNFFFLLETSSASSWNFQNTWRDCQFENTRGGNIKYLSAASCVIERCGTYDLAGATTKDLYYFGTGGGALDTRIISMRDCPRLGGTLGAGLVDIKMESGGATTSGIIFDNCTNIGGSTFAIDCGSRNVRLGGASASATITNPGSLITKIRSNGLSVGPVNSNADTSGATLAQLETEVNELKALLRTVGFLA